MGIGDVPAFSRGMDKGAVTRVNPHMKDFVFIGVFKKDKVSDLQFLFWNRGTIVELQLSGSWYDNICFLIGVYDESTAIKPCFWRHTTPFIRAAKAFHGMLNDGFSLVYGF